MKLKYLIFPLIISASMGTAYAETITIADGTVEIKGKVVSQTCTVNTGGNPITVTLPTVGTESLKQLGAVVGATPFHIDVTGCSTAGTGDNEYGSTVDGITTPSSLSMIGIYFSGININNDNGTLINTAATSSVAKNVNVQLLNKDMTPIDLTKTADQQTTYTQKLSDATNGVLTFNFGARYYATGVATPGDVEATVPFVIVYK